VFLADRNSRYTSRARISSLRAHSFMGLTFLGDGPIPVLGRNAEAERGIWTRSNGEPEAGNLMVFFWRLSQVGGVRPRSWIERGKSNNALFNVSLTSRRLSVAGPDLGRVHVSARTNPTPAVAREAQKSEGQRTRRCCREAAVGSKHTGHGRSARRGKAFGRRHSVDDGFGECIFGAAKRRNGCRTTHASEGPGQGEFEIDRATEVV